MRFRDAGYVNLIPGHEFLEFVDLAVDSVGVEVSQSKISVCSVLSRVHS